MKLSVTGLTLGSAFFLIGCGPEAPSVRYSGSTLAAKPQDQVKVFRATEPDRPFQELGTVDVSCPTALQGQGFGSVAVEGGCTYDAALAMATERAAQAGADALFGIHTSAGGNGSVVALTAVAVRFVSAPLKAKPAPAKPSVEERLKKLQQLADQGLITADEYAQRKAEILKEL